MESLLGWFVSKKETERNFYFKIFGFFLTINLICYWVALITAFSGHITSNKSDEYILIGFPASFLGALFDSFSLVVTLYIVKKALSSNSNLRYVAFLSVDLVIAVLATFWVLFAFVASGWIVGVVLDRPETFASRSDLYEGRFLQALLHPFEPANIRNIYFGTIMGASALLPTLCHIYLAARSFGRWMLGTLVPALR